MNPNKKLLVTLSCGHTVVLDRHEAAQAAHGTTMDCKKCDFKERRIVERSWVSGKDGHYQ